MRHVRLFWLAALAAVAITGTANADLVPAPPYTGTLTTGPGGGIVGSDNSKWNNETTLSWTITKISDTSWNYAYVFSGNSGPGVSHIILQASDSFGQNDILGSNSVTGSIESIEVGDYSSTSNGSSNPYLPELFHGIKVNTNPVEGDGWIFAFDFDSRRVPVWGDFYAKGGSANGGGKNGPNFGAVWNTGFTAPDPSDPAANGSAAYNDPVDGPLVHHLLVPDSIDEGEENPEPATVVIFSLLASLGAMWISRRRAGK